MSAKTDAQEAGKDDVKEQVQPEFQVVDKRHFSNLDGLDKAAVVEEKPRYPSFVEELMARMAATERKFEERKAGFEAEIARIRARLEADFSRRVELEKQKMVLPFLDVLDNLERALAAASKDPEIEHLRAGVELTASLFRTRLQELGIEAIPVLDQAFDPNFGQAVGMVSVSDPAQDGVVKEEVLRGYRMGEQVLRPAQVLVGKHD